MLRVLPPLVGQSIDVVVERRRTLVDQELAGPQTLDDPLQHPERQAGVFGQRAAALPSGGQQSLEEQPFHQALGEAGLLEVGWLAGPEPVAAEKGREVAERLKRRMA